MVDISVKCIVKAFEEDKNILDGIGFELNAGERVGLLGKNGCGKTTLFRLMTGELESDEGDIVIASGKRLGLISQIPKYPEDFTTEDVLKTAHSRIYQIKTEMSELEKRMASDDSAEVMRAYDKLLVEFERLNGYEIDTERSRVANGLEIPQNQRTQKFSTLSGGEKTRVNLARLILEKTDILLLDEPTNHLDLRATEWLEEYLTKFKGTVLVISHDRYFLDRVVSRTIEIVNGKEELYGGNYSFYIEEKERRYIEQLKKYEKEQSEVKRLQTSADRLYQWGTGNKNLMKKSFAIQTRIERLKQTDRPTKEKRMHTQFGEKAFRGDEVMVIRDISKCYEGRELFRDIDLKVAGGERIALIGDNGTGKSTLLKLIVGEELPDSGVIKCGPAVKTAYLPQIIKFRNPSRNLLETMIVDENCSPQTARNRLGAFKFVGDDVFRPVGELSGGEQSRLRLCILMNEEINLLILDEPTNHLDIYSREWIEESIADYEEALLFVSHDRYFINRFANRIWELKDGSITDFKGTFEEYRLYKTRQDQKLQSAKAVRKEVKTKAVKKSSGSPEKLLAKLEREISAIEEKLNQINLEREEHAADYEKLMELDDVALELESQFEEKYAQWEQYAQ